MLCSWLYLVGWMSALESKFAPPIPNDFCLSKKLLILSFVGLSRSLSIEEYGASWPLAGRAPKSRPSAFTWLIKAVLFSPD